MDASTEHGTCGVEVVIYLDPEVVANSTDDNTAKSVVAMYTYSGISASQLEILLSPQVAELTKAFDFEKLNTMPTDELLISLCALLTEYQMTGSAFLVFGYDDFKSAEDYSQDFETWSCSVSRFGSKFSGGGFYSYSNKCFTVGAKVGRSTKPNMNLLPFYLQYSHTYYSDPIYLN